ncbi:MAG TPA: hypothetical protein VJ772_06390 [Nitrososphaeraceae archaeon]|nr:hypothetical protein [Nitrososphaeraceae archaeon]
METEAEIDECPKCHSALHEHSNHIKSEPSVVQQLPYKSPGTTSLIAFLGGIVGLAGIGHMYVGKVRRGIIILIGGIVLFMVSIFVMSALFTPSFDTSEYPGTNYTWLYMLGFGLIPTSIIYLIYFIWQIFDARKFAKKFNEMVKTTGKEPW